MTKRFSKKYRNKEWDIDYMQSEKLCQDVNAWCHIATSLPPEPWLIFYYDLKLKLGIGH